MGEFSLSHILILSLILLIFFGPSRLPQLGQSLGKAIRGFKEGLNEVNVDAKDIGPQAQINNQNTATSQSQEKTEERSQQKS